MTKIVFVTGASSGLGKSTAAFLAQKGYTVIGTCRDPKKYPAPDSYSLWPLDLNDSKSIVRCVQRLEKEYGRVDVLINNAGQGITGPVEELEQAALQAHFNTNCFGPLAVIQQVLPLMRAKKQGLIINITSIGASMGLPFRGAYSASKGALQLLSEALRMEVRAFGIDVVTLAPGDYATAIADRRYYSPLKKESPYFKAYEWSLDTMNAHVDEGNDPREVAEVIAQLITTKKRKVHYRVGPFMQKLSIFLKGILPSTVFEKLLRNHYKL